MWKDGQEPRGLGDTVTSHTEDPEPVSVQWLASSPAMNISDKGSDMQPADFNCTFHRLPNSWWELWVARAAGCVSGFPAYISSLSTFRTSFSLIQPTLICWVFLEIQQSSLPSIHLSWNPVFPLVTLPLIEASEALALCRHGVALPAEIPSILQLFLQMMLVILYLYLPVIILIYIINGVTLSPVTKSTGGHECVLRSSESLQHEPAADARDKAEMALPCFIGLTSPWVSPVLFHLLPHQFPGLSFMEHQWQIPRLQPFLSLLYLMAFSFPVSQISFPVWFPKIVSKWTHTLTVLKGWHRKDKNKILKRNRKTFFKGRMLVDSHGSCWISDISGLINKLPPGSSVCCFDSSLTLQHPGQRYCKIWSKQHKKSARATEPRLCTPNPSPVLTRLPGFLDSGFVLPGWGRKDTSRKTKYRCMCSWNDPQTFPESLSDL